MPNLTEQMTDKERIYAHIIRKLYFTMAHMAHYDKHYADELDGYSVYFDLSNDFRVGDVVVGITGQLSPFTIGMVHEIIDNDHMMIRGIGTNEICDYSNEKFIAIRNLYQDDLYDGDEREIYNKIYKAHAKGYWDAYGYLIARIDIHDREAIIWIREKWGGHAFPERRSVPFLIHIHWNKHTTISSILDRMKEQGYGTHEFQYISKGEDWKK